MFKCKSQAFANGVIHPQYGIESTDVQEGIPTRSLPIEWADPPEGTVTYALVFEDFDNIPDEGVCWIHWLAADIPAEIAGLSDNASITSPWLVQGKNSWHLPYGPYAQISEKLTIGYGGPAPERPHEYELTLYALNKKLGMKTGFFYNELRRAMEGHILGSCCLKATYLRKD